MRFRKLVEGDCGLVLYYVNKEENKKEEYLPMGLFFGKLELPEGFPNIYQAIILSQALEDIKQGYPHQLGDIRLFQEEPPLPGVEGKALSQQRNAAPPKTPRKRAT